LGGRRCSEEEEYSCEETSRVAHRKTPR
jgi:hypothetical protein